MTRCRAFFGGPEGPRRLLRDLLEERVRDVPTGGEILWVTYYFRDQALAEALVRAQRRGVSVKVVVEGRPRLKSANEGVTRLLEAKTGLGPAFRSLTHRLPNSLMMLPSRLHEKLYFFSHPRPVAFVGSFNPSGNQPEDPDVIRQIGDQDQGHNGLVEISDPRIVQHLAAHARWLHQGTHSPLERLAPELNRTHHSENLEVHFSPRKLNDVVIRLLQPLASGARLRAAVSHFDDRKILQTFTGLASKGVHIQVIAHDTLRRVPKRVERLLLKSHVDFRRYVHPRGFPMHNKFLLIESEGRKQVVFGSANLSLRSRLANHEIVIVSRENTLFHAFEERWEFMKGEPFLQSPALSA